MGAHPVHPKCPGCSKSLYKAFEKGKAVKKTDPWDFCRNVECRFGGPERLSSIARRVKPEIVAVEKSAGVEVYGEAYAKIIDADRGKIQPVRGSALGHLIQQNDIKVSVDDGGVPRASVEEPKSIPEREIFFWKKRYSEPHVDPMQLGSHVTKFTPNWCKKHHFAYEGDPDCCPACARSRGAKAAESLREFWPPGRAAKPTKPTEHPAVAETRKRLEPLVKMLAPSDAPPASVGLIMALLNQATGSKEAANLLIDEYGLDKKFGLQKF